MNPLWTRCAFSPPACRECVAHELGVEHRLEKHCDEGDPEQREPVAHECGGSEKELSAADRRAEHYYAGADDSKPADSLRGRRRGELGSYPRVESRSGFGIEQDCGTIDRPAGDWCRQA